MPSKVPCTGEKASAATERSPDVTQCSPPRASSVMMLTDTSTSTINVVLGRRERRGFATRASAACRSASRRGDQHLLERLELLEALPAADGHAVQRVAGHHD